MANETLTVRPARRADLAALDALFARSYPALLKAHYPPSVLVTAVPLIARANPRLIHSGTYFVVTDMSNTLVGAGGWTRAAPNGFRSEPQVGNIRHVVTDVARLREGVGRALMQHILASAQSDGVVRLDCLSTRMAVPFYEACGFRLLGSVTVSLAPGIDFPALRMQRYLV